MVQKVAEVRGWASPKTLSVNPAVNGHFFSNQGRVSQRKETDGLQSFAVPKIQWDSNPMGNLYLYLPLHFGSKGTVKSICVFQH